MPPSALSAVWLGRKVKIWLIFALSMAGLCVNKQLELQSLFTDRGRVAFCHGGWFEQRRDAAHSSMVSPTTSSGSMSARS